jgi:L-alanine-DL-glutamate epimerase-like enolase superfamily enzyme
MKQLNGTITDEVAAIGGLHVSAYTIPTSSPESDGTIQWNSTTLILAEIEAADKTGIGYTYGSIAIATVIEKLLKDVVVGRNVMNIPSITEDMVKKIRNDGSCGIAMMAVSAVDTALWDLKAKLFNMPLCTLLGKTRDQLLIYGSGGFTSYDKEQLQEQLSSWAEEGIKNIKIKIGRNANKDVARVQAAREAIGEKVNLFVDANGAYTVKQSIEKAHQFNDYNISWFEEPVSSDNLQGLHFIRDHVQPSVNIAAGEYGYNLSYFKKMLEAEAADVLQADATRCGGITGFLKAGYLAEAYSIPFSFHCAPCLHLHAALALPVFYIGEYFHDHVRIESLLFDGFIPLVNGYMKPDESRPGMGIEFRYQDAVKYKQ